MDERPFKNQIYKQFSRIGKCLSSEKRLEMLHLLSQGTKSVEKLAEQTNLTIANASQHLQILAEAQLVTFTKKGTYVFYELANPAVVQLMQVLWMTGEQQIDEILRIKASFIQPEDELRTMTLQEAILKQQRGEILLVDVRPSDEYDYEHIPGALSIPYRQLEDEMNYFSMDKEIVMYCRGPYCIHAAEAVKLLRMKGYKAFRIEEGINEWRQLAYQVSQPF